MIPTRTRGTAARLGGPVLGLLLLLLSAGCSTVPITGRTQFNIMSQGEEMQLGLTEFDKLKKDVPISKDPALNAMVQKVGKRIAAAAGSDMPNAQWEFVVFESKEANAFCLPGGKVGIYTGILPVTKDESGIATVMGHEVAHAVARHGGERMTEALGLQVVGAVVTETSKQSKYGAAIATGYGLGAQLGVALPHSRKQESEADEMGLVYMARAGYRPAEAVEFWKRFAAFNQSRGAAQPWFLRTHPTDDRRIADLQRLLPKAEAVYRPAN